MCVCSSSLAEQPAGHWESASLIMYGNCAEGGDVVCCSEGIADVTTCLLASMQCFDGAACGMPCSGDLLLGLSLQVSQYRPSLAAVWLLRELISVELSFFNMLDQCVHPRHVTIRDCDSTITPACKPLP